VMVVSHSMGTPVWLYFMQWVEAQEPGWIDREVGTWVNLAGSLLGAPKALTSVISAEMRDTAIIEGTIAGWLKDKAFPRSDMIRFFRSLGSLPSLFPLGGERVWGPGNRGSDNKYEGSVLSFFDQVEGVGEFVDGTGTMNEDILQQQRRFTANSTLDLLRRIAPDYMSMVDKRYMFGVDKSPKAAGKTEPRAWSNPLATALPHAPGLAIACMYGVGKPSELGYAFRSTNLGKETAVVDSDGTTSEASQAGEKEDQSGVKDGVFVPVELDFTINTHAFSSGVRSGDGDGTVPLASLGLMCVHPDLWKGVPGQRATKFNPSGAVVRTREYPHEPLKDIDVFSPISSAVQGGGGSSDHVDILGNLELQRDLILMATSNAHEGLVEDRIVSSIEDMAKRVAL